MNQTAVKLAICIPSGDMVHMDFAVSLSAMLARLGVQRVRCSIYNAKTTILSKGRQTLVNQALSTDSTHILFLDSDMSFPADTAIRLLQHNLDIVGAAYPTRREERMMNSAQKRWGERLKIGPEDGVVEVDYIGFGVVLFRAGIFRRLDKPWFPIEYRGVDPEKGEVWVGEDFGFCEKARAAGYRIHVDAGLSFQVGHAGQRMFRMQDIAGP